MYFVSENVEFSAAAVKATRKLNKKSSKFVSLNWVICLKGDLKSVVREYIRLMLLPIVIFSFSVMLRIEVLMGEIFDTDLRVSSALKLPLKCFLALFLLLVSLHNFFTFVFGELLLASSVVSLLSPLDIECFDS